MFSRQRLKRNQSQQLNLHQQLEPRTMLAALAGAQCTPEFTEVVALQTPLSESNESNVATALSFQGRRFRAPSLIQAPTTEQLGELDGSTSVEGSNSFYDRIDRYEFEVSEDGQLNVDLEFDRNTFSQIAVFDQSRQLVAVDWLRRDSEGSLTAELDAGEYTAIVFNGYGQYELDINFTPTIETPPANNPVSTNPGSSNPEPVAEDPDTGNSQPTPTQPTPTQPTPAPQTELQNVDYYGSSLDWNLNSVNAPEAWQAGHRGDGVVVAVIDTGVNINHSDLDDNIWVNSGEIAGDGIDNDGNGYVDDRYGWNFVDNNANVNDDNGHGTHVAGTVAAEQNGFGATGVAPDAEVLAIKVLNSSGSGFVSSIANGIRYAVDNGADIINLSLGGGGFSSVIASALSYAASNDVFVVAAAGNESASVPGNPASFSSSYSNVLSVGAHDSSGRIAGFSNGVGRSGAVQVDAPGVNIYSTAANGGYTFLSGTSMAAPHVAGLAALTLSANSNLTASSLRNIIVQTSNRSASGSDAQGVVNASLAIPQAINSGSANIATVASVNTNNSNGLRTFSSSLSINQVADLPDLASESGIEKSDDLTLAASHTATTLSSEADDSELRNGLSSFDTDSVDELFASSAEWSLS